MAEWENTALAKFAEINPRRPAALRSLPDAWEVTFVPMSAVDEIGGIVANPEVRPIVDVKKGFTYFEERDVIFAKITPCMQNGKCAIAQNLENGLGFGSTEFHVVRTNPEKALSEWIWYFLRQRWFRREAMSHFRGAVGQQRVPGDFLAQTEIPLPPLEDQRRIVARIKECMERVEEIEALRAEQFQQATTLEEATLDGLIDPSWPTVSLSKIASDIRNGWSGKQSQNAPDFGVLKLSCVHGGALDTSDTKPCKIQQEVADSFRVRSGDIFLVRGNGSSHLVGRSAIAYDDADDVIFNDLLIRVRLKEDAFPTFVNLMMRARSIRTQIANTARTAAGIWKINQKGVQALEVPLPDYAVQEAFVETASAALGIHREIARDISESGTAHLRDAILRKAFAGEL